MTSVHLTVSGTASATNAAVNNVLRSGTQPHSDTVSVSRAGSQTTGDTTSTAYTVTTQNAIGGVAADVTQQTSYSSSINGDDNLISYASVAGQGVNFHTSSPDNVAYTPPQNTQSAPVQQPASNPPANNAPPPTTNVPQQQQTQAQAPAAQAAASTANNPPPVTTSTTTTPAVTPPPTNSVQPQTASAPGQTPNNSNTQQDTGSGGYTALANASASTIRGGTLNVVT